MRKLIENWPLDGFIICNRHVSAVRINSVDTQVFIGFPKCGYAETQ